MENGPKYGRKPKKTNPKKKKKIPYTLINYGKLSVQSVWYKNFNINIFFLS